MKICDMIALQNELDKMCTEIETSVDQKDFYFTGQYYFEIEISNACFWIQISNSGTNDFICINLSTKGIDFDDWFYHGKEKNQKIVIDILKKYFEDYEVLKEGKLFG